MKLKRPIDTGIQALRREYLPKAANIGGAPCCGSESGGDVPHFTDPQRNPARIAFRAHYMPGYEPQAFWPNTRLLSGQHDSWIDVPVSLLRLSGHPSEILARSDAPRSTPSRYSGLVNAVRFDNARKLLRDTSSRIIRVALTSRYADRTFRPLFSANDRCRSPLDSGAVARFIPGPPDRTKRPMRSPKAIVIGAIRQFYLAEIAMSYRTKPTRIGGARRSTKNWMGRSNACS